MYTPGLVGNRSRESKRAFEGMEGKYNKNYRLKIVEK
jgi:hypothetical protein